MNMRNGLTALFPTVVYNAKALFQVLFLCDLGYRFENFGNKTAIFGRNIGRRGNMLFRNNYCVKRRFRVYIGKGIDPVVFVNFGRGDLPRNYFSK